MICSCVLNKIQPQNIVVEKFGQTYPFIPISIFKIRKDMHPDIQHRHKATYQKMEAGRWNSRRCV